MKLKERKIAVSLLKAARKLMLEKSGWYVCTALNVVCTRRALSAYHVKYKLQQWIAKLLENESTLEGWVSRTHPRRYGRVDFRQLRIKWLDWMIWEMERP